VAAWDDWFQTFGTGSAHGWTEKEPPKSTAWFLSAQSGGVCAPDLQAEGEAAMSNDNDVLADWFKHPGMKLATERVNAELDRRKRLLITLALGTDAPVDQRAVDKQRGVIEGVSLFLQEAKRGARAFERNQGGE
jgi:hypothetical protein